MLHIGLAIIVEGKYDKMRVERVCDAPVFTTGASAFLRTVKSAAFCAGLHLPAESLC